MNIPQSRQTSEKLKRCGHFLNNFVAGITSLSEPDDDTIRKLETISLLGEKYPQQNMSNNIWKVNATIYEKDNAHDCMGFILRMQDVL